MFKSIKGILNDLCTCTFAVVILVLSINLSIEIFERFGLLICSIISIVIIMFIIGGFNVIKEIVKSLEGDENEKL
jgi:hypothetical protein